MNVARALQFWGHLPMSFWGECMLSTCYLFNQTPSRLLNHLNPYEKVFGKSLAYVNTKIFCR